MIPPLALPGGNPYACRLHKGGMPRIRGAKEFSRKLVLLGKGAVIGIVFVASPALLTKVNTLVKTHVKNRP